MRSYYPPKKEEPDRSGDDDSKFGLATAVGSDWDFRRGTNNSTIVSNRDIVFASIVMDRGLNNSACC